MATWRELQLMRNAWLSERDVTTYQGWWQVSDAW
jgi:hypothetical protein